MTDLELPEDDYIIDRLKRIAASSARMDQINGLVSRDLIVISENSCSAIVLRRHSGLSRSLHADGALFVGRPFNPAPNLRGAVAIYSINGLREDAYEQGQPNVEACQLELIDRQEISRNSTFCKKSTLTIVDVLFNSPCWVVKSLKWSPSNSFEFIFDRSSLNVRDTAFSQIADSAVQSVIEYSSGQDWPMRKEAMEKFTSLKNPVNRWDAAVVLLNSNRDSGQFAFSEYRNSSPDWLAAMASAALESLA